jgi:hypothetical protein
MLKKVLIGLLVVTVIGASGAAIAYNVAQKDSVAAAATPEPLQQNQGSGNGYGQQGGSAQVQQGEPGQAAEGFEGEPWSESGTISEIDDYGFSLSYQDGQEAYVELGPPDYWQNQGVDLQVGQPVTVNGSINEGMIHASTVVLDSGQTLQIRSDTGQPLWSGGVDNNRGQQSGSVDGDRIPDPQAQVDEWVTIEGTLMSFQGGTMTMSTSDGEIISFQTGQPRFFAEQGITFQVGDEIIVLGFYENDQFSAGEITQVSTNLRVMLRDPNGRPLWAGPGSGNGGGNGGGNGSGNGGGNSQAHGKGA